MLFLDVSKDLFESAYWSITTKSSNQQNYNFILVCINPSLTLNSSYFASILGLFKVYEIKVRAIS